MSSVVYEFLQYTQMFQSATSAINNRKWTPLSHTCVYQILLCGQPSERNNADLSEQRYAASHKTAWVWSFVTCK